MNLKEEIDRKMWHGSNIINDDRYFLPVDDAMSISESYAKEKAWEAWKECNRLLCNVISEDATPLFIESMLFEIEFEKWWEENK